MLDSRKNTKPYPTTYDPKISENHTQLIESLKKEWQKNLKPHNVPWLPDSHLPAIIYMYARIGGVVTHDDLSSYYNQLGMVYNKQVRHIAENGWWIETGNRRGTRMLQIEQFGEKWPRNAIRLATVKHPNPIWLEIQNTGTAYQMVIKEGDWEDLLELFRRKGRGCSVCGRHFKSYDKGHLDPMKAGDIGNLVPMCSECNNWAANKAGNGKSLAFELDTRSLVSRPIINHSWHKTASTQGFKST